MTPPERCKGPECLDSAYTCIHLEKAVEKAVESAVHKVFALLGVDVNVPKEVEDFRRSLRVGQNIRTIMTTTLSILLGGVVGYLVNMLSHTP